MTINPKDHTIQLKSKDGYKDYLPVAWRLVWFREQCPQGTIETEEMCIDLDREVEEEAFVWNAEKRRSEKVVKHARGYARFRAVVTDGKGGRATGTKSENAASFPDFIEKAETGSIGRALAALGFGTQFTGDEFDESHRIVDAPIDRSQPAPSNTTNTPQPIAANITEQQMASIRNLSNRLNKPIPDTLSTCTYNDAVKLIQALSAEHREKRAS